MLHLLVKEDTVHATVAFDAYAELGCEIRICTRLHIYREMVCLYRTAAVSDSVTLSCLDCDCNCIVFVVDLC